VTSASTGFRPDVQGLRAVAVLLVALNHANVGPFASGYIGVDVFFVISGFLITGLLLREGEKTGGISLLGFYARRAKRILPAATLTLVVVTVAAAALLSRVEAAATAEDAVWATLFAANVKFGHDGTDYFAQGTPASPLQHFWSLSIEEQYYLVWPTLLLLIFWLARRRGEQRGGRFATSGIVGVLLTAIIASATYSVVATGSNPVGAYFSTWARIWELAIGGLAAVAVPAVRKSPAIALSVLSWLGVAAITWGAIWIDVEDFPGWVVGVPVVGTAMLLLGGSGALTFWPQTALSVAPMRLIGDWSYSFYLWHWPVLVFAARLWRHPQGWVGIFLLVVAFAISGLSYHYVENAFRKDVQHDKTRNALTPRARHRGLLLYPLATVMSLVVALGATYYVHHADSGRTGAALSVNNYGHKQGNRLPSFSSDQAVALVQASALATKNEVAIPEDLSPDPLALNDDGVDLGDCDYLVWPKEKLCPRGDTDGDKTLVLLGDSHGRAWIPALDRIGEKYGWKTYYFVKQGCTGAQVYQYNTDSGEPAEGCMEFRDWAIDQIDQLHPQLTIMASDAPFDIATDDGTRTQDDGVIRDEMVSGTVKTVDMIRSSTDRVVVIGDVPGERRDPARCLTGADAGLDACSSRRTGRQVTMNHASHEATKRAAIDFVDPTPWFCAYDVCPVVIGSDVAYRDREHISTAYSTQLAPTLADALDIGPGDPSASAPKQTSN
jgi:peptidoglycan/LPS O-acetylase OafA/YrhL